MKAYVYAAIPAFLLYTSCAMLCPKPKVSAEVGNPPADVIIDHQSGTISPAGLIRRKAGDDIRIEIQRTSSQCYSFNVATAPTTGVQHTTAVNSSPTETVPFNVHFDGDPITISISAYKKNDDCPTLVEHKTGGTLGPWEIKVDTAGWDLAFAGAFTADKLTDPSFTLEESSPATTSGPAMYKVTRIQSDSVRLGSAAMVHLYHTEPDPLGAGGVNLVPFSFGLGVGDSSNVRYLLGTGIRFDKKLFLTVGAILGPQKTLSNIPKNGLTPDANFLKTNGGTRTAGKLFFSVSYSFIGVGADAFKKPFSSVLTPQPSNSPSSGGGDSAEPDVNADITGAGAGDTFTFKLEVTNAGGKADNLTLDATFPANAKGTWKVKTLGGAQCSADQGTAQAKLTAMIASLPKSGECEYDVTLDKPETFTSDADVPRTVKTADGKTLFPQTQ